MRILNILEKSYSFWFLLLISFVFFLLRWPSLFEPYWYGDEGIYQAVGLLINNGHSLYSEAWENKPPLLLIIYSLLNSDQFLIRIASLIFGLISICFFYFSAKKLFPKNRLAITIPTSIYALLFGTNLLEGNIANAENFMLFPILAGFYLFLWGESAKKSLESKIFFSSGLILSIAFLIKVVAVFDFVAFAAFLFFTNTEKLKKLVPNKLLYFIAGFLVPAITTASYFLLNGNFRPFMDAFILRNVSYVGYENELFIPQGFLILKLLLLGIFTLFLYFRRNKISRNSLLIFLWFGFSLFNVYFSQRPYTHYLLLLLPSLSLMLGLIISEKKERLLALVLLFSSIFIINQTFVIKPQKIIPYYSNLINFCWGRKNVEEYQSFFDKRTPKDYLLANYLKITTKKDDGILIWGNNAQVYKLADRKPIFRYTVAYHILGFPNGIEEMEKAIENVKPKYIVIMPDVPAFPFPTPNYSEKAVLEDIIIYEKVL